MVDALDHSRGILIDLDHAIRTDEDEDGFGYVSLGQRCLAMELLRLDKPPVPLYKHDLESFLWSFWDIVLNYVRGVKVLPHEKYTSYSWGDGSLEEMWQAKSAFLTALDGGPEPLATEAYQRYAQRFCLAAGGTASQSLRNFLKSWSRSYREFYVVDTKGAELLDYEDVKDGIERMLARYST